MNLGFWLCNWIGMNQDLGIYKLGEQDMHEYYTRTPANQHLLIKVINFNLTKSDPYLE